MLLCFERVRIRQKKSVIILILDLIFFTLWIFPDHD
jgi:hypothetical protein